MRTNTKKPSYITEQHKMNINGKTGTQILDWCNDKYKQEIFGYEQSVSRVLVKGRTRLESVCNLVFP